MKSLIKYIHVIINYQSNRTLEKILTGNELIYLSGSLNVKSLDVIDCMIVAAAILNGYQGLPCKIKLPKTATATIAAIEAAGGVPVLVDISASTYTLCPKSLLETIHKFKTQINLKVILPVCNLITII